MMPLRGAASAVANGKKTLSDSEVLAYSKNRFVELNLRQKVKQLSDQEQVCHDSHQREILSWRNFMRQSSMTTGVWSTEFNADAQLCPEMEDEADPASAEQHDENPFNTAPRGSPKTNSSTELARSLTFHSEALTQLQKPWVYTYSETSHNTLCKDALEVARVKEKRLFFRQAALAMGAASLVDPLSVKPSSRAPSSRGLGRQKGSRPLTGRSTPGINCQPSSDSRQRLSASAQVNKNRSKTSVGVLQVNHGQHNPVWVGREEKSTNNCESNHVKNITKERKAGPRSSETAHMMDNRDAGDGVMTTVLEFINGKPVQTVPIRRNSEDKLPALSTSKHVTVTIISGCDLTLNANTLQDSFPTTLQDDGDTVDSCSNQYVSKHINEQANQQSEQLFNEQANHGANEHENERLDEQTNQQTNQQVNEQENQQANKHVNLQDTGQVNQQINDAQGDDGAVGQVDTMNLFQTAAESRARRQRQISTKALQFRFAVWKQKAISHPSDTSSHPGSTATVQSLTTLPKNERQIPADPEINESQSVNALALKTGEEPSRSALRQSEDPANSKDDRSHKAVTGSTSNTRTSLASGQRINGNSEQLVSGFNSVPVTHSPPKRRGSVMKIVDQMEALRTGNRRRSLRVDDGVETHTDDNEKWGKPEQETATTTTDKPITVANDDARHGCAKITSAAAVIKKLPDTKPENKPTPHQLNKSDEASHANQPVTSNPDSHHPIQQQTLTVKDVTHKAAVEASPRNPSRHERFLDDVDFNPSDVRSLAESDYTTFKGYKIRNYVRPQFRHRMDSVRSNKREKSMFRLTLDYPVYVNGNRRDFKSQTLFSKTCRQKVLQELVHRNHQPAPVQDSGVVPPQLKAKIDEFLKTIEPYCPKSGIIFHP